MTLSTMQSLRQKSLEKRLADLTEEFVVNYDQLGRENNVTARLMIERRIKDIEKAIEKVEKKLKEFDAQKRGYNHYHLDWEEKLPDIDFKAAASVFQAVEETLDFAVGGAVVFLLPDSGAMAGELYTSRLKKHLQQQRADLKYWRVGFGGGKRLDKETFLSELGQYLLDKAQNSSSTNPYHDLSQSIPHLIDCLTSSVHRSGSVIMLEVDLRDWDGINLRTHFLPWFLQEFWTPLVDTLPILTSRHPRVKYIALIHTPPLDSDFPDDLCCSHEQFNCKKLLPLPLELWTASEITNWLYNIGLTGPPFNLPPEQIDRIAERVCRRSNHRPKEAQNDLKEELRQLFQTGG